MVGGTAEGRGEQANEAFDEPTRDQIPQLSRQHVAAMEATDDDAAWVLAGMHHVVLRTIGRRSGNEHRVALPFFVDGTGERVVVASFAGAPTHPSWYLNLADPVTNATVHVRTQHGAYESSPEILDGDDYVATWATLVAARPYYDDYQSRCARRIPLVRLTQPRP